MATLLASGRAHDGHLIMKSVDDGLTWLSCTTPGDSTNGYMYDVAFGQGVAIACGYYNSTGSQQILRSVDQGTTWNALTTPGDSAANYSAGVATDGSGNWVVAISGTNQLAVMYSRDNGLTWTIATTPLDTTSWGVTAMDVAFGNGVFMWSGRTAGVGSPGVTFLVSTDLGRTWVLQSGTNFAAPTNYYVDYLNGAWWGTSENSAQADGIFSSIDNGNTWTRHQIPSGALNSQSVGSLGYAPSLGLYAVMAKSPSGNGIYTSPDGSTWTLRYAAGSNFYGDMIWTGSRLISGQAAGTPYSIAYSLDGVTWTPVHTPMDWGNWFSGQEGVYGLANLTTLLRATPRTSRLYRQA